jgi:PLP dependent protein
MTEALITSIRERYQHTLARIVDASVGCGRSPDSVRLVVVSKSQPVEILLAAVSAGISLFGENYVEEAVEKINTLAMSGLEWHMIGHVQSRKAEMVAANFTMLHSLDSLKLAGRLERFCGAINRTLPVLLECNVSGEASKFGFPAWEESRWPELAQDLKNILVCSHLQVRGLMTMPPFFDDPECTRLYFQRLVRLQNFLNKHVPELDCKELSMGTSVDFIAAIQEGATMVRIGQAILGPRII